MSSLMDPLERLVPQNLRPLVHDRLDPLQCVYQADIPVEDAISYLPHRAFTRLKEPQITVGITFFDFFSAFKSIWPLQLAEKLSVMQMDRDILAWIIDYLCIGLQYIRLQDCLSGVLMS